MAKKIIYLVGIPWDSHSIDRTEVFFTLERAQAFVEETNSYNSGYVGGLFIETVEVVENV